MKIQLNIINPNLLSVENQDKTMVVGVMMSDHVFEDFDTHLMFINADESGIDVEINLQENENLLKRADRDLENSQFHQTITAPVWKTLQCDFIGGEIAFVNTSLPLPKGESGNAYVFFGILQGDVKNLIPVSEQVIGADLSLLYSSGPYSGKGVMTGINCRHQTGNHLLDSLKLQAWGFDEEKYGMRTLLAQPVHQRLIDDNKHVISSGQPLYPDEFGTPDPDYVQYLKMISSRGGFTENLWLNEQELSKINSISKNAIIKISRELEDGPSP